MTSVYSDEDTQGSGNVLDSLSLRRTMARPENSPFGLWWSYTIEEMLSWPILEYQGNISIGLDALMDSSDEEEESGETNNSRSVKKCSLRKWKGQKHLKRAKQSLDDDVMVRELIENFLKYAHTMNPILEPALLRMHAANMVENGLGWDGETCQVVSLPLHEEEGFF